MLKKSIQLIIFILLALVLLGCAASKTNKSNEKVQAFQCQMPSGVKLGPAMAQVKTDLTHQKCQYRFDEYFEHLLEIATGDPKAENKIEFSRFLIWANEQGILTRVQAKQYYNQYFNTTFVALPDNYNICSHCPDQGEIIRDMEAELRKKEKGLMQVCKDKESYYKAYNSFDSIILVLDATCSACGD